MKFFDKFKSFYNNHKTAVKIAICVTGTAIAAGVGYAAYKHADKVFDAIPDQPSVNLIPDTYENEDDTDIDTRYEWKEEYRNTYDLVKEFASGLELKDGEAYIIEHNSEWSDDNIVSHMIDETGVYPPDEV